MVDGKRAQKLAVTDGYFVGYLDSKKQLKDLLNQPFLCPVISFDLEKYNQSLH